MIFEWDENKNLENIEKHGVSFEYAQRAFVDRNHIIISDAKHSLQENRYYCVGSTDNDIITVRFTKRNGNIRIIGAGYWRKQTKIYKTKNNLL
ncbi:MAG: BrnT family toxin [Prevotellaceae bacterium]|jgi:uncharacterized DUF497 family protein|nr:BrnT family toxin [Prevotellaceae bacterium]